MRTFRFIAIGITTLMFVIYLNTNDTTAKDGDKDGIVVTDDYIPPLNHVICNHQRQLKEAGFYDGDIDGIAGPLTLAGWNEWEQWFIWKDTGNEVTDK